jgi:4-hydroxybenzoate polyprenyltransferase
MDEQAVRAGGGGEPARFDRYNLGQDCVSTANTQVGQPALARPTLLGHLQIARVDHWFKNVFVLPGVVVAISMDPGHVAPHAAMRIVWGLLAVCLIASSNYVINEVMDARFDRFHPTKCNRPVPCGRVSVPLAYAQWIALAAAGLALALGSSTPLAWTLAGLWLMGCIYNIPPVRSKDVAYLDVLSEAVNNPLRLLAGWFMVASASIAPASLLLSYWMIGCYFMAIKRFAECRNLGEQQRIAAYRKSLACLTERRMLVAIVFYGSTAMLFFGAFVMRYRLELILSFPLVAAVMATYLNIAFKENSAAQHPEKLYRERGLMASVIACTAVMVVCLFVDMPTMYKLFQPTAPVQHQLQFK